MPFAYTPPDGYKNTTSFPTTPSSETEFRASMQSLLDQLRNYLNGLSPAALVKSGGTGDALTLINAGTWYKVPVSTVRFNQKNIWQAANKRFLIPETKLYTISASVGVLSLPDAGRVLIGVYIDGIADQIIGDTRRVGATGEAIASGTITCELPAGSYVEIYAMSEFNASVVIDTNGQLTWMSIIQAAQYGG